MRTTLPLFAGLALAACGAPPTDVQAPPASSARAEEAPPEEPARVAEPQDVEEPAPEPAPPPEPEPVDVVAGSALGPIRIGMSEDEVRALGLEEREGDWRSRLFGPYRVYFDDGRVRRIEASIGALGRIRVGEHVFPSGTHIHQLRDAFGGCEWYEGGGERYRCAGGTLFVSTAHTMDPARYTIAVEDRE